MNNDNFVIITIIITVVVIIIVSIGCFMLLLDYIVTWKEPNSCRTIQSSFTNNQIASRCLCKDRITRRL